MQRHRNVDLHSLCTYQGRDEGEVGGALAFGAKFKEMPPNSAIKRNHTFMQYFNKSKFRQKKP